MPIRIPIIGQSVSTPFVPQQSRQAIQIDDPRGRALQGLGQGISDFGDGVGKYLKRQSTDTAADRDDADLGQVMRNNAAALAANSAATTDRDDASGAATWRASALEAQRQQNVNSWILRAYADNTEYGDQLANHLDPTASPAAAPPGATDGGAAGNNGAGAAATPTAPNPANLLQNLLGGSALGGLIGGAAGSAGAAAPGAPGAPTTTSSPTDPAVHGHTGAWLNGYDASARAAIAAAPDQAARQSLIQQFGANRAQGAQALMLREAQANVARRQSGYLADIQRIAATQVSANPESLPRILDLVERHPIRAAGDQPAFDAQVRQTLVGAAMDSLIARDPQGVAEALQDRADPVTVGEGADAGAVEAAAPAATTADHPVYDLLTPEERSHYLQQAQGAVYTAQSNAQADVLQRADAAVRGAQGNNAAGNPSGPSSGTPAAPPPSRDEFIRALGQEQGAQRFDAMQQQLQARQSRNALLPLPTARLSEAALANASPQLRDIIRQIQEGRRQSPIDAAFEAGSYGLKPMPFTTPGADSTALAEAIAGRAAVAGTIARAYDSRPALLSRDEVAQLAALLQGQKPDQQQALLRQLQQSTADPELHETTLRALSAHEPVIALAGLHMAAEEEDAQLGQAMGDAGDAATGAPGGSGAPGAQPAAQTSAVEGEGADDTGPLVAGSPATSSWGGNGKLNAADLLLRGYAQWRPKPDANGKTADPVAVPSIGERLSAVRQLTGGVPAMAAGQEAMYVDGTAAAYVGSKLADGDKSGTVDRQRLGDAALIAVKGNVPVQELASNQISGQGAAAAGDAPAADAPLEVEDSTGKNPYGLTQQDWQQVADYETEAYRRKGLGMGPPDTTGLPSRVLQQIAAIQKAAPALPILPNQSKENVMTPWDPEANRRAAEEHKKQWNKLGKAVAGPIAGGAMEIAERTGASPDDVDKIGQAVAGLEGSLGPALVGRRVSEMPLPSGRPGLRDPYSPAKDITDHILESPAAEEWGSASFGLNQGLVHHIEYFWDPERGPKRTGSLEDRLGLPRGTFSLSVPGFTRFTGEAQRVVRDGEARQDANGRTFYFLQGAKKPKEGVRVIVYDGKLQTMAPSDYRTFAKKGNPIK